MSGYGRSQPQQAEDPETFQQDQDRLAWQQMITEQRHMLADLQASQWSNQDQLHDARRANEESYEEARQRESQRQQDSRNIAGQAMAYAQHQQHGQDGHQYSQQDSQPQYAPAHQQHLYRQHMLMRENRARMRAEQNLRQHQGQQAQQQQPQWTHNPHQYASVQDQYHQQGDYYEDEGYEDDSHGGGYAGYGQTSAQQHQRDADWYDRHVNQGRY
ncbi:hypothetical protein BJ166DRAFT_590787 [Pestalotiopsis sp. NC0098]|nr:hypothetical protein BJ166DRAFT_590787 [Pestalotiopsis sp. NC0098]